MLLTTLEPTVALKYILEVAQRDAVLDVDLGEIDFSSSGATEVLDSLAEIRRDRLFGFRIAGKVRAGLTIEQCSLLQRAGVCRVVVEFIPVDGHHRGSLIELNMENICSAKLLHSLEIDVQWHLCILGGQTYPLCRDELVADISSFRHLPPPNGVISFDPRGSDYRERASGEQVVAINQALTHWRTSHVARVLTYARGPGFVRICDKRGGDRNWKFITLRGVNAEIYGFCRYWRKLDDIFNFASALPRERIRDLLHKFIDSDLLACTGDEYYMATAVRKLLEERWVSH